MYHAPHSPIFPSNNAFPNPALLIPTLLLNLRRPQHPHPITPPPPPPPHPRRIPPTLRHRALLPLKVHLLRHPTLPQTQHRRGHNNLWPCLLRRRHLLLRQQNTTATHHAGQRSAVLRNRPVSAGDLYLLGWEFPLPRFEWGGDASVWGYRVL